jgi:hypothetical protein
MTRNDKTARLPLAIRQQPNLRLQTGELAQDLPSRSKRNRSASVKSFGIGAEDGPDAAPESLLTAVTRT